MKFVDRLKQSVALTTTDTISLGATIAGYRRVADAVSAGLLAANDTACFCVEDSAGNWEQGLYTVTSGTQLTRQSVLSSSNGGAAVTFPANTTKTIFNTVPSSYFASVVSNADGVTLGQLPAAGTLSDSDIVLVSQDSGATVLKMTLAVLKAYCTNGAPAADTTAPSTPASLSSSNVAQTSASLNWAASTDNVGVSYYEVSKDGTTWTNVGTALTYSFTGLTAGTAYTFQVRAVDAAGNKSSAASLGVTTAAATGDTTAPTMAGSVTSSNVTASGLTMGYSAGSDNVGVTRYEVSVDTGTANWVNNGTNLSYAATGLTASTQYTMRVRCYDAAGNVSNVLTATATTSAAAPAVVFHFDGAYGTFDAGPKAYGAGSYVGFAETIMLRDASNNPISLATYDAYFVLHNSATVAPTTADALHASHSNTFALAGNATTYITNNSIFAFKDTMPAGTYYLWVKVVNKGAGASAAAVWQGAYDGVSTGVPVAVSITN